MTSRLVAFVVIIITFIFSLNIIFTIEGASFVRVTKSFRHSIQSTISLVTSSSSSSSTATNTNTNTIERNFQQRIKMDNTQSRQLPIYIPIGPQGAGKTTFLSKLKQSYENQNQNQNQNSTDTRTATSTSMITDEPSTSSATTTTTTLHDITIDDQDGVYIPTPIQLWFINQPPSLRNNNTNIQSIDTYLQTNVHGKTISNRIYNDTNTIEMRLVIQRLNNVLTAHEFRQHILSFHNNPSLDNSTNASLRQLCKKQRHETIVLPYDWKERLIYIVEEFCTNELKSLEEQRSSVVQLFIVESIFKNQTPTLKSFLSTFNNNNSNSNSNSTLNGINAASTKLNYFAHHESQTALAWGNTNTKARDYVSALEAAEKSQRPVIFIPYLDSRQRRSMNINMNNYTIHDIHNSNNYDESMFLPQVEINELIRRNIVRCYTTGKYVPVKAIIDACLRVDELMNKAMDEMMQSSRYKRSNSTFSTKQELDSALAKMAGFRMDVMKRTVHKASGMQSNQRKSNANQRKNNKNNRRYNF